MQSSIPPLKRIFKCYLMFTSVTGGVLGGVMGYAASDTYFGDNYIPVPLLTKAKYASVGFVSGILVTPFIPIIGPMYMITKRRGAD